MTALRRYVGDLEFCGTITFVSEPPSGLDHVWVTVDSSRGIALVRRDARQNARPAADIQPGAPVAVRQHVRRGKMHVAIKLRVLQPREQAGGRRHLTSGRGSDRRCRKSSAASAAMNRRGRNDAVET